MKRLCILIIFIIIGSGIYFNSLKNAFHYDDEHHIAGNSYIKTVRNIPFFFTQPRTFSVRSMLHTHYRPLVMTSYALNYYSGRLNTRGYHLVNLGFHIGSAFMLFLILQAMLITPRKGRQEETPDGTGKLSTAYRLLSTAYCLLSTAYFIPLAAGLIFLTTPYNSEVINYIAARSTVMCTFFYLLAFYFWIRFKTLLKPPPPFPPHRGGRVREGVGYYIASLLAFTLAMLTKEIAITLPVMLLLYDIYFMRNRQEGYAQKLLHYLAYLPFAITGSFIGILLRVVFFKEFIKEKDTDLLAHFIVETKVIAKYFSQMVIPLNLSVEHIIQETPDIYLFLSLILITALLVLIYLLWRSRDLPWKIGSFFIAWFFIALLPTSLVALNTPYQENRGYLSAIGLAVLLAVGLDKLRKRIPLPLWEGIKGMGYLLGYALIGLLIIAYSIGVVHRNPAWLNDETLWSDVLKKYPISITAHLSLGNHYLDLRQLDRALAEYQKIIRLDPYESRGLTNIGIIYMEKGDLEKAEEFFRRSLEINPIGEAANLHMAKILQARGELPEAAMHLLKILSVAPDHIQIATILIDVFDKMGVLNEFHKGLLQASEKDPDNPAMIRASGIIYMKKGQWREAAHEFETVLSYMPDDPKTLLDLGNVYFKMGLTELAEERHLRVLTLYPKDYFAYQSLASIYQEQGKFDKALALYKRVLEEDPKAYKAYNNIGFIYTKIGEDEKAIDAFKRALEVDPSYHLARLNLAKVYERKDKKRITKIGR